MKIFDGINQIFVVQPYTQDKVLFKSKKSFFNFISSIRSKNTFRTNMNLFGFKKSRF